MAKQDYLPTGDGAMLTWHDNWKTRLHDDAATLGLTSAKLQEVDDDNAVLRTDIDDFVAKAAAYNAASSTKKSTRRAVEGRTRELARNVKSNDAYDEALGSGLGIEGPEDSTDLSQLNPDLQLEAGASGHVTIKFNKRTSDGVNIYSRRAGEAQSTFLARDSFSPYVDNRPNLAAGPEKREYFGVYVENDDEIGPASPVVSVTLG